MKYAAKKYIFDIIDYPVFSEINSSSMDLRVLDTEYRILRRMDRIAAVNSYKKNQDYSFIMKKILASANGAISYDFPLEDCLNHAKELGDNQECPDFIPMTIIAWKIISEQLFCSVERVFLKWDNLLSFEDNLLTNMYIEQVHQIVAKLLKEQYYPIAAIGKGDYVKTLRTVFSEQFIYTLI